MKKWFFVLLAVAACLYFSIPGYNYCIKGKYESVPDGTVLYVTDYPVFDIDKSLQPIDSVVVEDGEFELCGNTTGMKVCFISSSLIADGGYFVLEPGVTRLLFKDGLKCGGTPNNEELGRFMQERANLSRLKRIASPSGMQQLALSQSKSDSIVEFVAMVSEAFDSYAIDLIRDNIDNCLGHFYLTQSAGIVSPEKLVNLFLMVPDSLRDIIYEGKMALVEKEMMNEISSAEYIADAAVVAKETAVGKKYRNFELDALAGGKVELTTEVLSHDYTLLAFWAGWNRASHGGMAEATRLLEEYGPKGLQFVSVALDSDKSELRKSVEVLGLKGVLLCNPDGGSAEVASMYGISGLPVYILINKDGTVIARTSEFGDIKKKISDIF